MHTLLIYVQQIVSMSILYMLDLFEFGKHAVPILNSNTINVIFNFSKIAQIWST